MCGHRPALCGGFLLKGHCAPRSWGRHPVAVTELAMVEAARARKFRRLDPLRRKEFPSLVEVQTGRELRPALAHSPAKAPELQGPLQIQE